MRTKASALLVGLLLPMVAVVAPVAAELEGDPVVVALEHLAQSYAPADLAGVIVTDLYTSDHNDVTHVYLQQTHDQKPVSGAVATVNVQDDDVIFVGDRFVHNVAAKASGTQSLTRPDAVRAIAAAVDGRRRDVSEPTLVYRKLRNDVLRLSYNADVIVDTHHWNVWVDAATGAVIDKEDWVDHHADPASVVARTARPEQAQAVKTAMGDAVLPPQRVEDGSSYNVFPAPLESPLDGDRSVIGNPADAVASPFGWHDTDGAPGADHTITRGNNVHAYADTFGATVATWQTPRQPVGPANAPDPASEPDGGDDLAFDFPIPTYDASPLTYRDAAVTNLFFWNNVMHDVTYRYGFDEKAGNFQQTNYTGEGKANDHVLAEAQDGTVHLTVAQPPGASTPSPPALNANFSTPPDGGNGRMQMYLWVDAYRALMGDRNRVPSHQVRDGDLDNGVIAHEYGHGVSNRLVGGPSNVGCLRNQAERQGEGWSDWWSFVLTTREGDDGATPRGIGNYVVYYDEGRTGPGIRITPYSTDMKVNRSTYRTIRTAAEPHGVGYVWATMLWDMYWNLVEEHGFNPNFYESWETGGNNLAIQLAMDSMKFSTCDPGFVDARDAILAADAALTGNPAAGVPGENECLLWRTFARRGLGFSADQGDPYSKTDGREGFDVPPHCGTG
ncbi:MAG TPA: M36 family metallopeptidase [Egibacteraceae bacterium]|nr:M36 family metallopeptidase [Egibacteraceae bacterium]